MHQPVRLAVSRLMTVARFAPDADPPRRVAGGASLGRSDLSHSLSSPRAPPGSGPMPNGSSLRRHHRLSPTRGESNSWKPSSHPMARFRRTPNMSRMRSVVPYEARSRVPRDSRTMALTPSAGRSHTRSQRSLPQLESPHGDPMTDSAAGTQCVEHRVGPSLLDPLVAPASCDANDQRARDVYDRRLPIPETIGHPGSVWFPRPLLSPFDELRTGADGVSRRRCALR